MNSNKFPNEDSIIRENLTKIINSVSDDKENGIHSINEQQKEAILSKIDTSLEFSSDESKSQAKLLLNDITKEALSKQNTQDVWFKLPIAFNAVQTQYIPHDVLKTNSRKTEIVRCTLGHIGSCCVVKLPKQASIKGNFDYDPMLNTSLTLRELRALVGKSHPNIVNVFEAGHLTKGKDEFGKDIVFPYVAMEYLEGITLWDWMQNNTCNLKLAASIVAITSDAIQFCHQGGNGNSKNSHQEYFSTDTFKNNSKHIGFTHGDISPNNIMICDKIPNRQSIKVIDFGMSDLEAETPGFGDPLPGGETHQRRVLRDTYSLGALLYYCVTGVRPPHYNETLRRRLTHEEWLKEHALWVESIELKDEALNRICRKALRTCPEDRYQFVNELKEDLEAWSGGYPLPHVKKGEAGDYTWWEKERMLFSRCWNKNDERDHAQLVSQAALMLSLWMVFIVSMYIFRFRYHMSLYDNYYYCGRTCAVGSLFIPVIFALIANLRFISIKHYLPFINLVIGICIIPEIHYHEMLKSNKSMPECMSIVMIVVACTYGVYAYNENLGIFAKTLPYIMLLTTLFVYVFKAFLFIEQYSPVFCWLFYSVMLYAFHLGTDKKYRAGIS